MILEDLYEGAQKSNQDFIDRHAETLRGFMPSGYVAITFDSGKATVNHYSDRSTLRKDQNWFDPRFSNSNFSPSLQTSVYNLEAAVTRDEKRLEFANKIRESNELIDLVRKPAAHRSTRQYMHFKDGNTGEIIPVHLTLPRPSSVRHTRGPYKGSGLPPIEYRAA